MPSESSFQKYEDARDAYELAIEDAQADYPDVNPDDLAHDIWLYLIIPLCTEEIGIQIAEGQLGWDREADAELFRQHGMDPDTGRVWWP